MSNNEIHELHFRLKYLLFHCLPTLKDLLEYFVKIKAFEGENLPKDCESRIWKILHLRKNNAPLAIKNFDFRQYAEAKKIEISKLNAQEICGILLSEKLALMKSECCCQDCEHECMVCDPQSGNEHTTNRECYKKRCINCGMNASGGCRKEAFVQALLLIEQLYEVVCSIEDPNVYEAFFQEENPFQQLPDLKRWPILWSAVQKSMATFCDFLSSKGFLEIDDWKDRDMEIRIVLKKGVSVLNYLYEHKMIKNDTKQRNIDSDEESE